MSGIFAPPQKFGQSPLDMTRQVLDISVTERNSFKTCRRRWWLDTIQNLQPRGVRTWYLDFGHGLHMGLEALYRTLGDLMDGDPLENARDAFNDWVVEMEDTIDNSGLVSSVQLEQREKLTEFAELGDGMLENYVCFIEDTGADNFTICAVEGEWTEKGKEIVLANLDSPYGKDVHPILHESGRFLVPIVDPDTKEWIPNNPFLSAKLDLIVYVNATGLRGFWVEDHKSSASKPDDRGIEMDDQVTGYAYTFWRLTGIIPRGVDFNYLIKQLPKEPRVGQRGLSYAKDQLTLPGLYRDAMIEHGLMKDGKVLSDNHAVCYEALLAHGWGRFFQRIPSSRSEHHLANFEDRLPYEYARMLEASKDPWKQADPHLSQYVCPGCAVQRVCNAMETGSDYEYIIENAYEQAPDRKAK